MYVQQMSGYHMTELFEARRLFFFCQAEDGIRDHCVTGVQTCALPILFGKPLENNFASAEHDTLSNNTCARDANGVKCSFKIQAFKPDADRLSGVSIFPQKYLDWHVVGCSKKRNFPCADLTLIALDFCNGGRIHAKDFCYILLLHVCLYTILA